MCVNRIVPRPDSTLCAVFRWAPTFAASWVWFIPSASRLDRNFWPMC